VKPVTAFLAEALFLGRKGYVHRARLSAIDAARGHVAGGRRFVRMGRKSADAGAVAKSFAGTVAAQAVVRHRAAHG